MYGRQDTGQSGGNASPGVFDPSPVERVEPRRPDGGEALWTILSREKVSVVFGLRSSPLFAHRAAGVGIRRVVARHESRAAQMADGFARASGRTGVVVIDSAPGLANLVAPLAAAMTDGIPLVCIAHRARWGAVRGVVRRELDILAIVEAVTKHLRRVDRGADVASASRQAFGIARAGRPGPVLIDLSESARTDRVDLHDPGAFTAMRPSLGMPPIPVPRSDAPVEAQDRGSMASARVVGALLGCIGPDAMVVTDLPSTSEDLEAPSCDRCLLVPPDRGALGFAVSAAIGASLARPAAEVWALTTDESFMACIGELCTISQEGIPLRIAVVNDSFHGIPAQWRAAFDGRGHLASTPALTPDLCALAEAHGLVGYRVMRRDEIPSAVAMCRNAGRGVLLDLRAQ